MPDASCNAACRRAYAAVLREFLTGRSTNREYEDRYYAVIEDHGVDDACHEIHCVFWGYYCDLREHVLDESWRRSPEVRQFMARCLLILHSSERHSRQIAPLLLAPLQVIGCVLLVWAIPAGLVVWSLSVTVAFLVVFSFLWLVLYILSEIPGLAWRGEHDRYWPFESDAALDTARAMPWLLTGTSLHPKCATS